MAKKASILLIGFNRPNEIKTVLAEIIKYEPSSLYISLDAPRKGNANDIKLCHEVYSVVQGITYNFPVKIRRLDENAGCGRAVVSAIDWFFSHEKQGIILEDDIIPHYKFFDFVHEMLNYYQDNKEISSVLGFNLYGQETISSDYFFYEGFYPWGWGTWKDRWLNYSCTEFDLDLLRRNGKIDQKKRYLLNSLILNLSLIRAGILDTWDYQFMYMMYVNKLISIAPNANLIKNIGADGAHSVGNILNFEYGVVDQSICPIDKPVQISEYYNDLFLSEHYFGRKIVKFKLFLTKLNLYSVFRYLLRIIRKVRGSILPQKRAK